MKLNEIADEKLPLVMSLTVKLLAAGKDVYLKAEAERTSDDVAYIRGKIVSLKLGETGDRSRFFYDLDFKEDGVKKTAISGPRSEIEAAQLYKREDGEWELMVPYELNKR